MSLLNKLNNDRVLAVRRFLEWTEKASLTWPESALQKQESLSLEWTEAILRQSRDIEAERKR